MEAYHEKEIDVYKTGSFFDGSHGQHHGYGVWHERVSGQRDRDTGEHHGGESVRYRAEG